MYFLNPSTGLFLENRTTPETTPLLDEDLEKQNLHCAVIHIQIASSCGYLCSCHEELCVVCGLRQLCYEIWVSNIMLWV